MPTLPSEYLKFKSVWESVPTEERSVNKLIERLRLIGMRLPLKAADSTALVATRKKIFKKLERKCYMYYKPLYLSMDCWKKESKPKVGGDAFLHEDFLAKNHVILNHGQVTWTTPELAPPFLTTTPHQQEDVSALDRFNVHRCPTRRVFSSIEIELVTRQATIRYLYHLATAAVVSLEQ
ncbi:uncharacterized protein TNCV_3373401 [Trichonephila clavipes]|nr:uncharacterized protein TNCV_3373401 [Trichonephila clavipes]